MSDNRSRELKQGEIAPDFTLLSTEGDVFHLYEELEQTPVVLFFYLKAFTPLCTSEACSFQSQLPSFEAAGATVAGISSDAENMARQFRQRFKLAFPLLLDSKGEVRNLYQVPKFLGIIPGRSTYVINQDRRIAGITHAHTKGQVHIEESLQFLQH